MRNIPASSTTARMINDRTALDLFVQHETLSAPQLKELTGLSRPSVADLVQRLQDSELIRAVGTSEQRRRGPSAKVYGLVADKAYVAGVETAEETIHVTLTDLKGVPVASATRSIVAGGLAPLIKRAVSDAVRRAGVTLDQVHVVVIGAPGAVDAATGVLGPGYHFDGWDETLMPDLVDTLNTPIVFENEVNLAGLVELSVGAGQGRSDLAVLWLDRSVGASIILEGKLRQGVSGASGEISKAILPGAGFPVAGKAEGGLHDLVSADAVKALGAEHGLPKQAVSSLVAEAMTSDSVNATAFVAELEHRIAMAVLTVVAVIDPGLVVLAGDIGQAGGERLADGVTDILTRWNSTPVDVRPSTLPEGLIVDGAINAGLAIAHDDIFGGGEYSVEAI